MPSEKRARQRAAREARLAAEAKTAKRRKQIRNAVIVVIVAGAIVGIAFAVSSNSKPAKTTTSTTASAAGKTDAHLQAEANAAAVKAGCPSSPTAPANHQTYSAPPPMTIDKTKSYSATVVTTTGTFVIGLNAQAAPQTVNNFVFLAQKGYFHCNSFFRVIPDFMNQTGNPAQNNSGGLPYTLPAENVPSNGYPAGSVAMASSSAGVSGDQFFIVAGSQGATLSGNYPLFGLVTSGLDVVKTINQQGNSSPSANGTPPKVIQRILSVTIHES